MGNNNTKCSCDGLTVYEFFYDTIITFTTAQNRTLMHVLDTSDDLQNLGNKLYL